MEGGRLLWAAMKQEPASYSLEKEVRNDSSDSPGPAYKFQSLSWNLKAERVSGEQLQQPYPLNIKTEIRLETYMNYASVQRFKWNL